MMEKTTQHTHPAPEALFIPVAAGFLFVYLPTMLWLWDRWTLSVWHHAHGLLIPPVVAYFCWLELRDTRSTPSKGSALGFLLLVPALLLHVLDTGMHTQLLSAASMVLALPGLSLLFLGKARTGRILLPLAFLALMLPLPLGLTQPVHLALRSVAADATGFILTLMGLPVFQDGFTLHLPHSTLLVADACSGFSTLYASVAMAMLLAYTTPSLWRRTLVLLLAAPVAVAANIVRVVLLAWLVHSRGTEVLNSWMHTGSGMLTFALALPVLFWVGSPPQQRAPEKDQQRSRGNAEPKLDQISER